MLYLISSPTFSSLFSKQCTNFFRVGNQLKPTKGCRWDIVSLFYSCGLQMLLPLVGITYHSQMSGHVMLTGGGNILIIEAESISKNSCCTSEDQFLVLFQQNSNIQDFIVSKIHHHYVPKVLTCLNVFPPTRVFLSKIQQRSCPFFQKAEKKQSPIICIR